MTRQSGADLLREISKILQYHESLGIKEYPRSKMVELFLQKQAQPQSDKKKKITPKGDKTPAHTKDKKHTFDAGLAAKATLVDVRNELGDCTRCPLSKTRNKIVFGQGSDNARLMIVTDAPDIHEDRQGAPFQGETGDLLDKMLTAIGLSRNEVYITSLVKCFPGNDAKPQENEIKTCLPFLFRQIEIICPTVICTMGMQASQTLLHSRKSLFQLRGRFFNFNDLCNNPLEEKIILMPSLHPSLLLKNADLKKASWQDLQLIQKKLEEN